MSYGVIILIGYFFNFICTVLYSIMMLIYKVDLKYFEQKSKKIKLQQQALINKSINPFRSEDFIKLLPFGYGLMLLPKIFTSKQKFIKYIYDYLTEKSEYYYSLESKYKGK